MGNLQEELEIRIEALKIALEEAMNFDEVREYIELNQRLLSLKQNKNDFSISGYNNLLDETMKAIEALKENANVKLFLDLLDKLRKSKEAVGLLQSSEVSRK